MHKTCLIKKNKTKKKKKTTERISHSNNPLRLILGHHWHYDNFSVCDVSQTVSSRNNMRSFAANAIEYLHRYNFDGLDIDWEFPADRGSPPEDKERFTQLLQVRQLKQSNE